MERTGPLFAVAQQAAAVEPLIAGFWQQGREQSRYAQGVLWTQLADDGLLPPGVDLAWLIDTASILAAAETYLLVTRMLGWGSGHLPGVAHGPWTRLLGGPGPSTGPRPGPLPGQACSRTTGSVVDGGEQGSVGAHQGRVL